MPIDQPINFLSARMSQVRSTVFQSDNNNHKKVNSTNNNNQTCADGNLNPHSQVTTPRMDD